MRYEAGYCHARPQADSPSEQRQAAERQSRTSSRVPQTVFQHNSLSGFAPSECGRPEGILQPLREEFDQCLGRLNSLDMPAAELRSAQNQQTVKSPDGRKTPHGNE